MSFTVSPAVTFREIDLSLVVGEEISSVGSFAGKFTWGPVDEISLVSIEDELVSRFGKPTNDTYVDFFSAAGFLSYTSGINIVRIKNDDMKNAVSPAGVEVKIFNQDDADNTDMSGFTFAARYPGALGNSIVAKVCASADAFSLDLTGPEITFDFGDVTPVRSRVIGYSVTDGDISDFFNVGADGDFLIVDGIQYRVVAANATEITLDRMYIGAGTPTSLTRVWGYSGNFSGAPDEGHMHIVLIDSDGSITGEVGAFLEAPYENLSTVVGAVDEQGESINLQTVINTQSQFIFAGGTYPTALPTPQSIKLSDGTDGFDSVGIDDYIDGYAKFADGGAVDVPLIVTGEAITSSTPEGAVLAKYIIDNIISTRRDGVAFISPARSSVVNNRTRETTSVLKDRALLGTSSYAMMDSGWKYVYDRYNNVFRWVPLNGDHAGIYARNDRNSEVWTSGAGTSKGVLKNVVKLAWSPNQQQRDQLYLNDVNPIVLMPVAGPTLMGDKTLLGKNSAFSRINTRRLFITLEKAIATAAAELLFEFNDEFTQRRFVSMVEPFMRDVKGRRGIDDYRIVADASVNTPQVVQNNRFVGQIFVKPKYSINFIRLDFVAVNAAASFDEVIGSV